VIVSGETYTDYDAALAGVDAISSVGKISWSGGYASGTYLGEGWVLTAAHVASSSTTFTFTVNGTSYTSSAVYVYDGWSGNASAGGDIALIQLSDSNVASDGVLLYSGTTSSLVGQVVYLSGYGKTGTGTTGATGSGGVLHAGVNLIEITGGTRPFFSSLDDSILLFDFDNPSSSNDGYPWSADSALAYEYMVASGDSGGGAFVIIDGVTYLVGVNSFILAYDGTADGSYGDIGGLTSVADYTGWIQSVTGVDFTVSVPEPATAVLLSFGGLVGLRKRKGRRRAGSSP